MHTIKVTAISHVGNSRKNHEDNYLIGKDYLKQNQVDSISISKEIFKEVKILNSPFFVAVSDGMGGYEGGEVASAMTVEFLADKGLDYLYESGDLEKNISNCISDLNEYICDESKKHSNTRGMGATLCGVVTYLDDSYCFNAGDSRLYMYKDKNLKQVSVDNTHGQRILDLELLTREEVDKLSNRKAMYKYIGRETKLIPDIYKLGNIEKDTILLLCSDGVSDALEPDEIQDILSKEYISIEDKSKFLVEVALDKNPSYGDNITLLILEY